MLNQWPHFSYDKEVLAELEYAFSQNSGTILGVFRHCKVFQKMTLLLRHEVRRR